MNNLLTRSLNESQPVEMIYLAANNQITHRRIIVKEMRGTCFKAFCFLRNDDRLFKVENILSIMPEKRTLLKTS
ncbi:MAG: hypothetical protein AB2411_15670 [Mesobacillus sp.]